ncbi:MAG TPA: vitamin K epoxide reductase family protein [Pseudonocardiaceae bacterium]|nr:vitamin K epoxide reductase family protein [Pseudonocardiaceae bacterium]
MAATSNKVSRGSAKANSKANPKPDVKAAPKAGSGAEAAPAEGGAPRWLVLSSLLLSIVGLGLSIYLTISHYTNQAALICQANSVVNCVKVTTSPESMIFGIPVAVLGLVFFVPMIALNSPWGWRSKLPAVRWLRLLGVAVGLVFVVYLVSAELIIIGSICEWCTGVHVITLALFLVVVIGHYRMAHQDD